MAKTFGVEERKIKAILSVGTSFIFRGSRYTVIKSGKPTCHNGELVNLKSLIKRIMQILLKIK